MERITLKVIAEKAGVSTATVSNALNNHKGVSEEIAQKVRMIASEMGYEAAHNSSVMMASHPFIRLVVFQRHGLVVMDTQFFSELIEAIEVECRKAGYDLMITHISMVRDKDFRERIGEICREECAGVILLATEMLKDDMAFFSGIRSKIIVLDSFLPTLPYNVVVMNNYEAGYMAGERLIRAGHKHIGHITSSASFYNMKYRQDGFIDCMIENNLEINEKNIIALTPTLDGSRTDMDSYLEKRRDPLPTAFFAANDILAVGAIRAMMDKGIRIPQDVSIIGMDDLKYCQVTNPKISTIRVLRQAMAVAVVRRLIEMNDSSMPQCILKTQVGVELIDRDSVLDLNS